MLCVFIAYRTTTKKLLGNPKLIIFVSNLLKMNLLKGRFEKILMQ